MQKSKKKEINVEDSSTKIDIQSYNNFTSVIDKYKKNIETMKRELNLNQYETIINNENEYKNNLEYLKKLEKETNILPN